MPVVKGTFGNARVGEEGLSTTLPMEIRPGFTRATFRVTVTADKYDPECSWCLYWFAIGSENGSPYFRKKIDNHKYIAVEKMSSTTYVVSGYLVFDSDDDYARSNPVTVYAKIACNCPNTTCYMGEVEIDYEQGSSSGIVSSNNLSLLVNGLMWDSGKRAVLTWKPFPLLYGAGEPPIREYRLERVNSADSSFQVSPVWAKSLNIAAPDETTYEIPDEILDEWKDLGAVHLRIIGIYPHSEWSGAAGTVTRAETNVITFKYRPDNTMQYYDGVNWVECIPYYHDGTDWIQCDPYYHDGNDWTLCSNS